MTTHSFEAVSYFIMIGIISYSIPIIVDRLGREYLIGLLPIYLLTGNILAESFVSIGSIITSYAIPIYTSTYLITDILTERYGQEEAKRAVWLGFIGQIFFVTALSIILWSPILNANKTALEGALGFMQRLILGSGVAYIVSQFLDIWVFVKIRSYTGAKHKWLRNNVSTLASQFIDTGIFLGIAFYGRPPFENFSSWFLFAISTWAFKAFISVIDTPFFYIATSNSRKK